MDNGFTIDIKRFARNIGFDLCRIIPIEQALHADFFESWLRMGSAAEMAYLEKNVEKRRNPASLLELPNGHSGSMIVLGIDYYQFKLPDEMLNDKSRGIIASYAWGDDYHDVIRPFLYEIDKFICSKSGRRTPGKCLIDTGPVLEHDWAHRAGIGFTGKNCCTIHPEAGSWLFLATIMVPEELEYDNIQPIESSLIDHQSVIQGLPKRENFGTWKIPSRSDYEKVPQMLTGTCGRCTRCLDKCPTDAFVGPFYLDPRKCISYWTIETKSLIPRELRPFFGNRIFGCDICQEVCPWNKKLKPRQPLMEGLRAKSDRMAPFLMDGFQDSNPYWLNQEAFSKHFRKSPIKRAKRSGMLRNVCTALGNWGAIKTVSALGIALNDAEPVVRAHAAWALGEVLRNHRYEPAAAALQNQVKQENHELVKDEIHLALGGDTLRSTM